MNSIKDSPAYALLQADIERFEQQISLINEDLRDIIDLLARGVTSFAQGPLEWDAKSKTLKVASNGHNVLHASVANRLLAHAALPEFLLSANLPFAQHVTLQSTHTPSPRTAEQWAEKRAQYAEDGE